MEDAPACEDVLGEDSARLRGHVVCRGATRGHELIFQYLGAGRETPLWMAAVTRNARAVRAEENAPAEVETEARA